jgi:hypothetical protein
MLQAEVAQELRLDDRGIEFRLSAGTSIRLVLEGFLLHDRDTGHFGLRFFVVLRRHFKQISMQYLDYETTAFDRTIQQLFYRSVLYNLRY